MLNYIDIADRLRAIVNTCATVHDYETKLQDFADDIRKYFANDVNYEQWSHFCDAIPQHITLWVDRCPHCGMPRRIESGRIKLVYDKATKRINKVVASNGLVLESFDPPSEDDHA